MRSVLTRGSRWARFAEGLAPHESPASRMVSAVGSRAQLAEAGRIEFVGTFPKLEQQLGKLTGINGRRDDRADAFCWGVHDLVFAEQFFAV